MKFVQWTLAVIGSIALLLVAAGFFLPSGFSVQRSVEIEAAPRKIYDLIVEPKRWKDWSVWTRRDPDMQITYSGPPFGVGAKWSWVSKSEGSGTMEFTRVEPDRAVEYALTFPEYKMKSTGVLRLEPAGKATRITWSNSGDGSHGGAGLRGRARQPQGTRGEAMNRWFALVILALACGCGSINSNRE